MELSIRCYFLALQVLVAVFIEIIAKLYKFYK